MKINQNEEIILITVVFGLPQVPMPEHVFKKWKTLMKNGVRIDMIIKFKIGKLD